LRTMLDRTGADPVVGVTRSLQMAPHAQSFLLAFGPAAVKSRWFWNFFCEIEPAGSKMQTIFAYEIGLSQAARSAGMEPVALLQPGESQAREARRLWTKQERRRVAKMKDVDPGWPDQWNPVHFLAADIARDFGFAKFELLRDNPNKINLSFLKSVADTGLLKGALAEVDRVKSHYRRSGDGLSGTQDADSPLPHQTATRFQHPGTRRTTTAVLIHLYYIDLLDELAAYLSNLILPYDLIVTTPFEQDVASIYDALSMAPETTMVIVTENRGRDIGPFMSTYRAGLLDSYRAVLKIHTKKSKYSDQGEGWRRSILSDLIGDSYVALRSIELLERDEIGLVGPARYYLTNDRYWGANRPALERICGLVSPDDIPVSLGFFGGSMFWFRPDALADLKALPEGALRFEPENGMQDGTLAHALERSFCLLARRRGYVATSVWLDGRDVRETDADSNTIAVL
ncbi:MAG: hypothetical protein LCH99_17935, partial [Proteobacteria bacterium]|nr:hypothetical protein [Pseudomonadota bacterium]